MRIGVIGSGIAGITAAIVAHERGDEVVLITKADEIRDSASSLAQGGIVYQSNDFKSNDSESNGSENNDSKSNDASLKSDILLAADGMANEKNVDFFVENAPQRLKEFLIDKIKVPFARLENNQFDLTGEAAHSKKRILFSKDNTGEVVINSLLGYLKKCEMTILKNYVLVDLINIPHHSNDPLSFYEPIRCVGGYFLDVESDEVKKLFFDKIIIATGGIGQIYLKTTNPTLATGDGIAVAYRSGARVINMEYTQFHPTSLAIKKENSFLISEALRGEGAILVNEDGEDFMKKYHPDGSLASRDVVSRAIVEEQFRTDGEIYLSLKPAGFHFATRFPKIYKKCIEKKINLDVGIPVTPAFHFCCGGILTDEKGETSISNLFAVGECACTGIHGANRLASTSLLEGIFFGMCSAEAEIKQFQKISEETVNDWENHEKKIDPVILHKDFEQLKLIMWNYVGIKRKPVYLEVAIEELKLLWSNVEDRYRTNRLTKELIELRNAVQVGIIVTSSALKNKKSSGCHYLDK